MEIIILDDASDDEKKVAKRKKSKTPDVSSENKESLQEDAEVKKAVNGNSSAADDTAAGSGSTTKESVITDPGKPLDGEGNVMDTTSTTPVIHQTKYAAVTKGKDVAKEVPNTTQAENVSDAPQKLLTTPSTQAKKESPVPNVQTDSLTDGIPPYNPDLPVGRYILMFNVVVTIGELSFLLWNPGLLSDIIKLKSNCDVIILFQRENTFWEWRV
jgi:hypothetical protein